MDKQFTLKLQEWINTPAKERDYDQGALFLLQLTNNKIMYRNISRDPKRHAEFLEFKIKRYLQYRLQDLTHAEVQDMQRKVDSIAMKHALDKAASSSEEDKEALSESAQFRAGKRADHDTLPAEIQALYAENADIMRKMRELHLQLRKLSTQGSTCPDSDRYPFLKEIIEMDKRYHRNWQEYDSYSVSPDSVKAEQTLAETSRLEQKNILRQINLAKGRFKKQPSDNLKSAIADLYGQLTAPSEKLTEELHAIGIF